MKLRLFTLAALLFTILACQVTLPQAPQATSPSEETLPTPLPPSAQPVVASPLPQVVQPAQPQPVVSPALTPRGFAAVDNNTLVFYEKTGAQIAQVQAAETTFWEPGRVHIAGSMPAGAQTVPLLYFSLDNGETLRYQDGNSQLFDLMQGQAFMGLTGIPGQTVIALSQVEYLDASLRSKVYAGSIQTLPSAAPLLTIEDPESWAIKPILVEASNGVPTRVWYTRIAYGIGGDIVFEPRKSLSSLDVASGQSSQILGNDASPWDLSPDRTWVAYSTAGADVPGGLSIRNLQTGVNLAYTQISAAEPRGAGNAFFSPNGQSLVWMEGDGWLMAEVPNYHATIRVGDLNGNVTAEFPDTSLAAAAPAGQANWVQPVGWLDDQTLLVQVRGANWEEASIMKIDLTTKTVTYLAAGVYVGLVYP